MRVREYILKFNSMARYASNVEDTMEDKDHRYANRLDSYIVSKYIIASLNKDMDIARMQDFTLKFVYPRQ